MSSLWFTRRNRRGFTLVELLVVIAIIGVLVALLLPAVQQAREAARRMNCSSNLKQFSLGMHNYHDTYRQFPAGVNSAQPRITWFPQFLPFIEQGNLYDQMDFGVWNHVCCGGWSDAIINTVVTTSLCPSDPAFGAKLQQGFHGNYVGNAGSTPYTGAGTGNAVVEVGDNLNGVFYPHSKIRMASLIDGTSNTLLFSEVLVNLDTSNHDVRGRYYNSDGGGCFFSSFHPPSTSVGDRPAGWCIDKRPHLPCASGGDHVVSARSMHPGGVMVGLCDGSVRFAGETIDVFAWQSLGDRDSGQTIGEW
ncbi:MAG: DUF1559 domain-containing protein [Pirellulaceae bacterium]